MSRSKDDRATGGKDGFWMVPDEFLGSPMIERQSAELVGAYVLLWMASWKEGLPDDDRALRRIARLDARVWARNRAELLSRFVLREDGRWHHRRALREKERFEALSKKRARSGQLGAARRWGRRGGLRKVGDVVNDPQSAVDNPEEP